LRPGRSRTIRPRSTAFQAGIAALIDIGAEWCAFCQTLESRILPDPDVRRLPKMILLKISLRQEHGGSPA
jgi:thiol:disulfide interchange protein